MIYMKFQIAVIGGGPAGYTAAETAGKAGMSVVLFEKNCVGGVCLNEGCIPTKTLLYSAKVYDTACHAGKYAVKVEQPEFDLSKIVARKAKVVRKLVLGIKNRLKDCCVTVVQGEAQVVDAHTIRCGEESYECEKLILCTGSETFVPPVPGIGQVDYWTHREALDNKEVPRSLAVVGGGVIGMEFASFFCSLGVPVTVIEMMDEILQGTDLELAALLREEYTRRGVKFLMGTKVTSLAPVADGISISFEKQGEAGSLEAHKVLMSVGRRPVTHGFGLEGLGLKCNQHGVPEVNEFMQASLPDVYICGDLNGRSLLAHTAVRQAEVAVHHILGKPDKMSYRSIPSVVYTNPEIASVGASEEALKLMEIDYRCIQLPMAYSGRFVAENEGVNGVCKIFVDDEDYLLGVHLLGNPASELIVMAAMMIEDGRKLSDWKRYVFPHPTVGEIFREAE